MSGKNRFPRRAEAPHADLGIGLEKKHLRLPTQSRRVAKRSIKPRGDILLLSKLSVAQSSLPRPSRKGSTQTCTTTSLHCLRLQLRAFRPIHITNHVPRKPRPLLLASAKRLPRPPRPDVHPLHQPPSHPDAATATIRLHNLRHNRGSHTSTPQHLKSGPRSLGTFLATLTLRTSNHASQCVDEEIVGGAQVLE